MRGGLAAAAARPTTSSRRIVRRGRRRCGRLPEGGGSRERSPVSYERTYPAVVLGSGSLPASQPARSSRYGALWTGPAGSNLDGDLVAAVCPSTQQRTTCYSWLWKSLTVAFFCCSVRSCAHFSPWRLSFLAKRWTTDHSYQTKSREHLPT